MKRMRSVLVAGITVLLMCSAQAQDFGFKGIGGKLGLVDPEALSATVGFGAHADLGTIGKIVRLVPSLEYWSKDSFSQFSINIDGRYYYSDGKIDPYVGAGLGLFFTSFDTDIELFGSSSNFSSSSTDLGLDFFGGLDIPIGKQWVFTGEVKYSWTELHSFRLTGGVMYYLK